MTKTMQFILNDLLSGTGWTGIADTNISRTVTGSNMSILDYIYKAIDTFKYEVKFDSVNKKVIAKEKIGSDKGVYFHNEVNLKSTNVSSDTYDFVTRIIPLGFDNLGIELINGGKSYVENHSYSNKIITIEWKDERYTVAENLKRDAELKLEKLCKPLRTYSCSIEDLSKSKDYSILSYVVGDTIDLIDREKGIREKQRITKTTKYLNSESEDTVEIANRPRIFGDDLDGKIENAINDSFSITNSRLELFEDKIIGEVETVSQKVDGDIVTINEKLGQLVIKDDAISGIVSDLTTTMENDKIETDNKVGQLELRADQFYVSIGQNAITASDAQATANAANANANAAISNAYDANQNANAAMSIAGTANDKANTAINNLNGKADKSNIRTQINANENNVLIASKNINLVGAVTVLSDLSNDSDLGNIYAGRMQGPGMDINLNTGRLAMTGGMTVNSPNGQVIIDGSSNMFKIHSVKTIKVDLGFGEHNRTKTIYHGLGKSPVFFAYQVNTPGSLPGGVQLPAITLGRVGEELISKTVIRASSDIDYIHVQYLRGDTSTRSEVEVQVYILKEELI